eukprot:1687305-Prymnesium_polylepis.1
MRLNDEIARLSPRSQASQLVPSGTVAAAVGAAEGGGGDVACANSAAAGFVPVPPRLGRVAGVVAGVAGRADGAAGAGGGTGCGGRARERGGGLRGRRRSALRPHAHDVGGCGCVAG